jgi:hypothetical protein
MYTGTVELLSYIMFLSNAGGANSKVAEDEQEAGLHLAGEVRLGMKCV